MQVRYFKEYSHRLGRDMEFKVYGHAGKPCIFFPCQDGRFFDFETFHMNEVLSDFIEQGRLQVYSVDTIDRETWSNKWGDCRWRLERQEQYFHYITDEFVPRVHQISGWGYDGRLMTFGCSMGAMHAAICYFRRPDLFDRNLSLSGIYSTEDAFGNYHDDLTYANAPLAFLSNMPYDHPYMELYRQGQCVLCVGQGAWEGVLLDSTRQMKALVERRHLPIWVDIWGTDVCHDWDWWYKQARYFMDKLL